MGVAEAKAGANELTEKGGGKEANKRWWGRLEHGKGGDISMRAMASGSSRFVCEFGPLV